MIKMHKDSEEFKLQKGIFKGYTISCNFFSAVLKEVFKKIDWEERSVDIDEKNF